MSPVACPTVHTWGEYVPSMHRLELSTIVLMMVVVVVNIIYFFAFLLFCDCFLFCVFCVLFSLTSFFATKREMYDSYIQIRRWRDQILHKSTIVHHTVLSTGRLLVFVDAVSLKKIAHNQTYNAQCANTAQIHFVLQYYY